MSPETRDFLATVRGAEDPSSGDERRVLAAFQETIAASLTSGATGSAPATKGILSGAGAGLKVVVGALLAVSVGAALVAAAVSSRPAEPRVAPPSNRAPALDAPVRSSAPAVPSTAAANNGASPGTRAAHPPNAPKISRPATPSSTASPSASLREELALLAGVQAALGRGDGVDALRRLDGYATNDRQFVAERRAARIAALCLLGRVPEARDLAAVFFRENARSVQRTAVEGSCAATETNPRR
jgi:hypothetical protein